MWCIPNKIDCEKMKLIFFSEHMWLWFLDGCQSQKCVLMTKYLAGSKPSPIPLFSRLAQGYWKSHSLYKNALKISDRLQQQMKNNKTFEKFKFSSFLWLSHMVSVKKFLKDFVNVSYKKMLKFWISQKMFWDTLGWNKTGACLHLVIFLSFQSFEML
mgnify:CR=1 FL=1